MEEKLSTKDSHPSRLEARSQPQVGNGRFLLETHRRSAGTLGRLFPYVHKCLLYRQKIVSEATLRKRLSFGLFQLESS